VVLECKTWGISTHDALTYSAKPATHKHVHPYLRYGILLGDFGTALPGWLIRHGAYFDFMMVWSSQEPTGEEWAELIEVLADEVRASRMLQSLLTESRSQARRKFRLLHRPLRLKSRRNSPYCSELSMQLSAVGIRGTREPYILKHRIAEIEFWSFSDGATSVESAHCTLTPKG
jgi:hypothetical protein